MDEVGFRIVGPLHGLTGHVLSIIPCLALRGVATEIAGSHKLRAKILLCKFR